MVASDPTTEAGPTWNCTQDPAAWVGGGGWRGKEKQAQGLRAQSAPALNSFGGLPRIPRASASPVVSIQQHLRGQESPQQCRKQYPETWGLQVSRILPSRPPGPQSVLAPGPSQAGIYLLLPAKGACLSCAPGGNPASSPAKLLRPTPGTPGELCEEPAPGSPSRPGVEARPRGADSPARAPGQLQGGPLPAPRASRARRGPAGPSPRSVPGPWPPWRAPHRAGGPGRAPGAATGTSRLRDALRPGGCG